VYRLASLLILTTLLLLGCATAAPTEAPLDARALLAQAAINLRVKQTFRVIIERAGADYLFATDLGDVVFSRAEGQFVAPDVIGAKVKIVLGELPIEADVYVKGADQSVRGIWTNMQWQQEVFAPGFDPSKILTEKDGLDTALSALLDPKLIGEETLDDGTVVYHITGTANGLEVAALVVNLIQMTGMVSVDVYLSKDSGLPVRFVIVQPDTAADGDEPTTWTIDLFDFDAGADVEAPG